MNNGLHFPYQKYVITFIFTAVAITLFFNSFFRHSLYALGIQIILFIQSKSNPILDWSFLLITMTIDPGIVFAGAVLMVILSHRKGKGLILLCFILINTFFAALIKAYDCDPRPIWTRNQIRNIGLYCPVQYGNPSGHSWFSAVLWFGVFLQFRGSGKNNRNIWICIAMIILVPISRMYLGAHSLNQVLQGLVFGMFFCLLYILGLKQLIHKFLAQFNHNKAMKLFIITLHIISLIPFIKHMDQQLPQNWLLNIHKKCSKSMNQVKLNQIMLTVNAVIINLLTGLALGYEQIVKSPNGAFYLTGRWVINQQKWGKYKGHVLFLLVEILCMGSGLGMSALFIAIHPTFVISYINLSIGGLVSGYICTSRTFRYLYKYKIIKKCYVKDKEFKQQLKNQQNKLKQLSNIKIQENKIKNK